MPSIDNNYSVFFRFIASVLIFSILSLYFNVAYAQADLGVVGRQGKNLADQITDNFKMPSKSGNNVNLGSGENLNLNEMFPGTSSSGDKPNSYFFPDGYNANPSSYEDYYDSGSTLDSKGNSAQAALYADAVKDDPDTVQGAAYKIIMDTANLAKPDLSQDPMFNPSRDVMENISDWKKNFGDCTSNTQIKNKERTVHVPEYESCERINKPRGNCEIEHRIKIDPLPSDIVFLIDNSGSMEYVISGIRNNVKQFAYLLGSDEGKVRLGAVLTRLSDYTSRNIKLTANTDAFQNWVNGVYTSSGETYVTNAANYVLDNFSFRDNVEKVIVILGNEDDPHGDYVALRNRLKSEGFRTYIFHDNSATNSLGTHIANVFNTPDFFRVAQLLTITEDYWTPQGCVDDAIATLEEFCTGSYEVTEPPSEVCTTETDMFGQTQTVCTPTGPCVNLSGWEICPGDPIYDQLSEPPIPNVKPLDKTVQVSPIQCNYNVGTMGCWINAQGEEVCVDNDKPTELNTCKALEQNPKCGFIESKCVEGAKGSEGTCYVYDETWDCGEDVVIDDYEKQQNYQCDGPIKCMGTDCIDISWTKNNDFGKAAALLNAAQFMGQDMACTGLDSNGAPTGNEPVVCSVFPGDAGECKKAVGGIVNCCEKPSGLSFSDYITLLIAGSQLDSAIMAIGPSSSLTSIKSAYEVLRSPITDGWQEVVKPFTNAVDSVGGIFEPLSNAYDQVVGSLREGVADLFSKAFGQQVAGSSISSGLGMEIAKEGWEQAAAAAGQDLMQDVSTQLLMENALNIISTINTIYTIYSVAIIVIKMIYECTDDELNLNVQRKLKNCHKVGSYCKSKILGVCIEKRTSYCCFSSPLSRIIQEQARSQLGRGWGDDDDPSCEALSTADLERLDWDRINLDEWLGILKSTGNWNVKPDLNISNLTGKNSNLDLGGRIDAEERALKRLKDSDVDSTRRNLEQTYNPSYTGSAD